MSADPPKQYDRHREFWIPGGDLYLLVRMILFDVAVRV